MYELIEKVTEPVAKVTDELHLSYDDRKRGRLKAITLSGQKAGLFLERGHVLSSGDRLRARSGEVIAVVSAPEPVVTGYCDDLLELARACYHLGNRHVPLQIGDGWVRIQPDHVLEGLMHHLGMRTQHEDAPFEPENGAYHGLGHGHAH
ncbi:urease accessory protein UreE [Marinobacteraceae bacterium S3BR75-40.1]